MNRTRAVVVIGLLLILGLVLAFLWPGSTVKQNMPKPRVQEELRATGSLDGPDPNEPAFQYPEGKTGSDRPNIVMVLTDDMRQDDLRYMPAVRELLGEQGTTFSQAISAHPLCCPARAAILTGQYSQNNGVKSNKYPWNYAALQAGTTLPVWLSRAQYLTGFTGKYLNGYGTKGPRQPGWTYWDPSLAGQYDYLTYRMFQNGQPQWYRDGELNNIDYVSNRTVQLVKRFSNKDKPFFIWASHLAPHGRIHDGKASSEALAPPRYDDVVKNQDSPSLTAPSRVRDDLSDNAKFFRKYDAKTDDKINTVWRSRIQSLRAVDDGIRDLITALREEGELSNTYIVFSSDNGYTLGEHNSMTKNIPFEESLLIPLVIRGPGVQRNVVLDDLTEIIDLAPTFASISNAAPLVEVDGKSLLPVLRGEAGLRDTVLIQAGPDDKGGGAGPDGYWWRGVRTDRYTYARWFGGEFVELYDRDQDPYQLTNLAPDPAYSAIVQELDRRTDQLVTCSTPTECSYPFGPVPPAG